MAIEAKTIKRMVRNKLKDNNELVFSDYDILNALNECIRYINQDLAMKNSDFLEKIHYFVEDDINAEIRAQNETIQARIDLGQATADDLIPYVYFNTTGVDLPDDFISLGSVIRSRDGYHLAPIPAGEEINKFLKGGYKVFANKIFANCDFHIMYLATFAEVTNIDEDTIEIPQTFLDIIVKVTCMILENRPDTDVLMSEISRMVSNIVPRRKYSNIKQRMPFHV